MLFFTVRAIKPSASLAYALALSFNASVFTSYLQAAEPSALTLAHVEQLALEQEPGLSGQAWKIKALSERKIAEGQLKDPKLQIGLNNLPLDTFDIDQENMTNFKIGLSQQFPAGDTLKVRQQKTQEQIGLVLAQQKERQRMILKDVRLTYLELMYWEQAKKTLWSNKALFSQLVDVVKSQFSVGRNNQQDLIRAQLELDRLNDRITVITQKISDYRAKLSRWIGAQQSVRALTTTLPEFAKIDLKDDPDALSQILLSHPLILQFDAKLAIAKQNIALVKESYKPAWMANVSYGYRDDGGRDRADFISAGITMDLPLFTENRQDKQLLFRGHEYQALKDQRISKLRELMASLSMEIQRDMSTTRRLTLYKNLLLPKSRQQTDASLLAYQSDQSNFSDVMQAYIDGLNAALDAHRISIDGLKTKVNILYFSAPLGHS